MSHPLQIHTTNPPAATPLPALNATVSDWRGDLLRQLVLADKRAVKIERQALLQLLAQADTPEQVVADLVAMFSEADA